ncbi:glutamate--cysteine ligase [Rathayibacter tanaceti]|uniref:Carboxylate-amine ligase n=2 Tax=Rathayibacter tanaceti TaxID=1671680 RepID=A0ACD2XP41_9MICO|nr:glutamate--cysteine ligase [Rathayibacter tanaceti]KZX21193.1 Carboxylate-amine ligase YbdK [Rathayibacter tanaceti]QHC55640.1 glutamate--cysteine ligase [Rathayibacter tanaceti]TCO39561.1 carboxylate-amine ligase [Rathayibacter tanaceti]
MEISFASSDRSTLGIEWEVAIVDRQTGDLANVADVVLEALRGDDGAPHPQITGELLRNTVELVSGVHTSVRDAVADLQDQLRQVREITDPMGLDLICSGTHPFAQWFDQAITDKERYHRLIDRTQWWGRNMMIWGIHVHVGIENRDKVLPILNSLLDYYPHLQALSASSPFWGGVDTGYASNRALMFQQLPTAGLPPQFGAWANYEEYVDDMTRTGVIDDHTEVRWDIRPSPQWGTLEMRACDGLSSAEEIGAVAALIQCLVEHLSSRLDAGEDLPTMQPWYVRENKWRAARYGLDAEIILDAAGAERLVTDDIRDLLVTLAPVAERLGCTQELADVELILVAGASYERQLRTAAANDGDLTAVVRALAVELRDGLREARA